MDKSDEDTVSMSHRATALTECCWKMFNDHEVATSQAGLSGRITLRSWAAWFQQDSRSLNRNQEKGYEIIAGTSVFTYLFQKDTIGSIIPKFYRNWQLKNFRVSLVSRLWKVQRTHFSPGTPWSLRNVTKWKQSDETNVDNNLNVNKVTLSRIKGYCRTLHDPSW